MGYAVYKNSGRYAGYGVPAYCEHPDCDKEIDRGMSFACGGEPFSEYGCELYFCGEHKEYAVACVNGNGFDCDCEECDEAEEITNICERCKRGEEPFIRKKEHPDWIKHLLTDESWAKWREENPQEVKQLTQHL